MATLPNVGLLEEIIRYTFVNKDWAIQALTAAHRTWENVSIDGNRRLAMVGDTLIESVMSSHLLAQNGDRAKYNDEMRAMVSRKSLANIARNSKTDSCIKGSPRQKQEELALPPRVLANAIKAIIAAVWKDSGENLALTRKVMARLAAFGPSVPAALSDAGQVTDNVDAELVDPRMISVMNSEGYIEYNRDNPVSSDEFTDSMDNFTNDFMDDFMEDFTEVTLDGSAEFRMSSASNTQPGSEIYTSGSFERSEIQYPNESFAALVDIESNDTRDQESVMSWPSTVDFEIFEPEHAGNAPPAASNSGLDIQQYVNSQTTVNLTHTGNSALQTATGANAQDRSSVPKPSKKRKMQKLLTDNRLLDRFFSREIDKWERHELSSDEQINSLRFVDKYISEFQLDDRAIVIKTIYISLASYVAVLNLKEVLESHHRGVTSRSTNRSSSLSAAQRYELINSLGKDIAYHVLLRRYHILMLYIHCLNPRSIDLNSGFINSSQDNRLEYSGRRRGNPIAQVEAEVTDAMVREIFPEFPSKSTRDQGHLRRHISDLRAFGKRLYLLSNVLGLGVLALLLPPSNLSMNSDGRLGISDACITSPALLDSEFEMLITLLCKGELPFVRFTEVAKPILLSILQDPPDGPQKFRLEGASREEIMNEPWGSEDLLSFLRPAHVL